VGDGDCAAKTKEDEKELTSGCCWGQKGNRTTNHRNKGIRPELSADTPFRKNALEIRGGLAFLAVTDQQEGGSKKNRSGERGGTGKKELRARMGESMRGKHSGAGR